MNYILQILILTNWLFVLFREELRFSVYKCFVDCPSFKDRFWLIFTYSLFTVFILLRAYIYRVERNQELYKLSKKIQSNDISIEEKDRILNEFIKKGMKND